MEITPEEVTPKKQNEETRTRLVSFSRVNIAFDEESSPEKYLKRENIAIERVNNMESRERVDSMGNRVRMDSIGSRGKRDSIVSTIRGRRESIFSEMSLRQKDSNVFEDEGEDKEENDENEILGNFYFKQHRAVKPVVKVRNATKKYEAKGAFILNGFGMTVEQGAIYNLVGASESGKSTVLKCILGVEQLESGDISVFGKRPGSPGCGVPGNRVGYMPKETSLYDEFSIDETLRYYGALFSMTVVEVKASRDHLMSFLDLPDESRRIRELTYGQKRKVCLALALLHSPEMLVLDEPTLGVDALLKERIWEHLNSIQAESKTTVIITTQNFEESKKSSMVGMMRNGRLLAEHRPTKLMKLHSTTLLEDVFLRLSRNDLFGDVDHCYIKDRKLKKVLEIPKIAYPSMDDEEKEENEKEKFEYNRNSRRESMIARNSIIFNPDEIKRPTEFGENLQRIKALVLKNFFVMWRNILFVLFMVMIPSLMLLLICAGTGNDPSPLTMGVVNKEYSLSDCLEYLELRAEQQLDVVEEGCKPEYLSCRYLEYILTDINLIQYNTAKEAKKAVKNGDAWGYMFFPNNYSDYAYERVNSFHGAAISEDMLEGSVITYQLDMTNKQVSGSLKKLMEDAYEKLIKRLLATCGLNLGLGDRPVKALAPIYGSKDTSLKEFIAPSILVAFLFFLPLCSSSLAFMKEKRIGTLERAQVAGVQRTEVLASFFISEGVLLIAQLALSLLVMNFLIGIKINGLITLFLVVVTYILMGFAGISAGFLLGSFCTNQVQVIVFAIFAFFVNFFLSGLIWPIMPKAMQYITYILPCTLPADAIRSMISRGWSFDHTHVWPGYAIIVIWIGLYLVANRYRFGRK